MDETPGPTAIVWRVMTHKDSNLYSGRSLTLWPLSEMTAGCDIADHKAPDASCTCGIYAYYEARTAWEQRINAPFMLAKCSYYGKTIIGDRGIRTEHLKIQKCYMDVHKVTRKAADALRDAYPDIEFVRLPEPQLLTTVNG